MRSLTFWLLLTLAVFVPATASLAATVLVPAVATQGVCGAAARSAESCAQDAQREMPHGRHAQAAAAAVEAAGGDIDCCESGCNQCMVCSGCSLTTVLPAAISPAGRAPVAQRRRLDNASPVPEFLLSGQERPPRRT